MNTTLLRILISVLAIPVLIGLTLLGSYYFLGLVVLLVVLGIWEYIGFARAKGAHPTLSLSLAFGVGIVFMLYWDYEVFLLPALVVFLMGVLLVEVHKNKPEANFNLASTIFGTLYVSIFFGCLVELRELPTTYEFDYLEGGRLIVTLYGSVWICDSAAYFGGRSLGRRKLLERVSPKKTLEGFFFGIGGAVGGAFLVRYLPFLGVSETLLSWEDYVVIGLITGTLGQWGDLSESLMKRDSGVKDSSSLIPGHGGVLDRFDNLMVVAPAVYLYLRFVVFGS